MSQKIRSTVLFLFLIAATAAVVALLLATRPQAKHQPVENKPRLVELASVELRSLQPYRSVTGVLRPQRVASLSFQVQGNLQQRLVEPGQQVGQGALLMQLDDADYRDALIEAEVQLQSEQANTRRDQRLLQLARDNRQLAEREFARQQRLGQKALASDAGQDTAQRQLIQLASEEARLQSTVDTAGIRLQQRQAGLDRARRNLDRTRLIAPFDGRINRVMVEVGDHVTATHKVLELIQDESLDLTLEVSGDTAAAIRIGQQVTVTTDGRELTGQVVALQTDPDAATHTYPIKIRVAGEGLLPGMLGQVRLPLRQVPDALLVPLSALLLDDGESVVFVVEDNRLQRRKVEPGIRYQGWQEIRSGVAASEQVVARDVVALSDGELVDLLP